MRIKIFRIVLQVVQMTFRLTWYFSERSNIYSNTKKWCSIFNHKNHGHKSHKSRTRRICHASISQVKSNTMHFWNTSEAEKSIMLGLRVFWWILSELEVIQICTTVARLNCSNCSNYRTDDLPYHIYQKLHHERLSEFSGNGKILQRLEQNR